MANQIASFNVPTEYDLERSKIDRAQRMAEMLMQQSQAPAEQFSYGGYTAPTPPITGVSKIIQGLMSQYQMGQADDKLEALGVKTRGEAADWMRELGAAQGAPAVPGRPAIPGSVTAGPADAEDNPTIQVGQQVPTMGGMGEGPNVGVAESAGSPEVPRLGKAAMFDLLARGQGNPVSSGLANAQLARLLAPPEFKSVGVDDRTGTINPLTGEFTETPGGEPRSPYRGSSTDAQDYNILLTGDPTSPVYKAAYNRQATIKMSLDQATGQIVYQKPDMRAFRLPVGSVGTAALGAPDARPAGISFEPIPGATPPTSESERKAATLWSRLQNSQAQLKAALEGSPEAAKPPAFGSVVGLVSSVLRNMVTPESRQQVEAAQLDILDAALTLGTGASYTPEQIKGYRESYFPQIGDEPKTIRDKVVRLQGVIDAAEVAAGRSAQAVIPPQVGASGPKTQDQQALDWAKANPKDPRSAAILSRQ